MDRERWDRIQAIFHEATEVPPAAQRAFVESRCPGDPDLAAEVLSLLAEDARFDSVLDRGLPDVAQDALEPGLPPPGRMLGRYRLIRVLGEGGMGVVYLAERVDLGDVVAIKFLRDAWLSPARRERFASEQRTLAQLGHPSIARLYDADTLPDGTPWFAMEYVDGLPLTRHAQVRDCSIRQRLMLFRGVCEAVLHAHQRAVIHRDLKPSNILVTAEGRPMLLDFGIARHLEESGLHAQRTRTELRLLTPAYAAPEQVRGEPQGVHTDVYALGVILYELLAGRPPFDLEGKTPGEVAEIVTRQEPEKPSVIARRAAQPVVAPSSRSPGARSVRPAGRGESWQDLDVLCLTALQKDPARRYRSVESLVRDLDHYLRGEPLEARPDTVGYRTGKFVRRHWRPLAATAATLVVIAGLATYDKIRLTRARNAALAEVERTHRIQEFMNGLFEGGDPEAGPPDTLRVLTLLDRGARNAHALRGDPAIQAELYQTLGGIYHGLGLFDRADSLLRAALVERRRSGSDGDRARSLITLALLRADQSQLDEAERLVREGLTLSLRNAGQDPAGVARARTALGTVLEDRGDYTGAIGELVEAARLDSAVRLPASDLSATLTELANCHFYAGHYAISDSLNRRLLDLDRSLHGERHPHVASDLVNLGAIQQEWGRWPEAERYYREALAIYRGWYGEDHYETASTLNMVGRALIQQERLAEARAPLSRALAIREHIYGPVHPNVASTLNELALLAQKEGRFEEADRDFRRMLAIYREVYHDHHYLIGLAYSNLATLHIARKDYAGAEPLLQEALRRYSSTLPPGHLYVGISRIKLGRALLRAGRYADAERESHAGYAIVAAQAQPSARWLEDARTDLVAEYQALGRPAEASKYRAELARAASAAQPTASR